MDLSDSLKYFIPSSPISFPIPNIYSKKGLEKDILDNNFIIINIFFFLILFYLLERSKVWIELLDLRDSLKYSIPSAPIRFAVPNIYSKKGL